MVFSRIAEIVSAAASRLSLFPRSPTAPYTSSGLPPLPGSHNNAFSSGSSGQKKLLRLSSSLQDFTAYSRLDPEEGDAHPEIRRDPNYPNQPVLQRENGGSSFSKDKTSPRIPKQRKWMPVILVLLCLLLVSVLIYVLQFLYFWWSQGASKYYVVIDCGSTGTRVYVYQASFDYKKDGGLPNILRSLPEGFRSKSSSQGGRAYNRIETVPGFDKLVHNISGLRLAINPLVQWAEEQIPSNAHKSTSLFLYATAGLRRLPSMDSDWLLNNAWSIVKNSPFLCKREWVKIISGTEEAYFGWIALNYHTDTLGAIPSRKTLGAVDLGGSSLQVTFESKEDNRDDTSLKLRIGPINYHLNAYSLSRYGLNDAFDKSVVHLVKRLPQITNADLLDGDVEVKHPCLQSGYKERYICSHCTSALQDGGSPTTGGNKLVRGGKPGVAIQLTGSPKWDECRKLARVAVNLSEWSDPPGIDCEMQPCALAENLPRPYGHFYAMSGFYVVYRFFNLTHEAALDDVLEKGQEFCEKTWDVAKNSVVPQPFIEQYCFRAPYIVFLLREGLHITDTDVTISSGSITWTLGVALLEAGKAVPARMVLQSYEILRMKINPVIIFSILVLSLFVLLCALFFVGESRTKSFCRPYLPLFSHSSTSSASVTIPAPFRFQGWSPGDGRVKMPLSPTIANSQPNAFDSRGIQLPESSLCQSSSSVAHSYSSDSLGQTQIDNGAFWTPLGTQMRLQSRRSQSRDDLNSSLADAHMVKA